jgi:predicted nucleotidyltransferase
MDYSNILKSKEYDFINTNEHLGKHVILLGLAGSYSYGTNNENSDIDVRGIALNSKSDLIGMTEFEQYVDDATDTTIYSFRKMVNLLLNCNPNTIELLGLKQEHYLFLNEIGQELLDNRELFCLNVLSILLEVTQMPSCEGCKMPLLGMRILRVKRNSTFLIL